MEGRVWCTSTKRDNFTTIFVHQYNVYNVTKIYIVTFDPLHRQIILYKDSPLPPPPPSRTHYVNVCRLCIYEGEQANKFWIYVTVTYINTCAIPHTATCIIRM